MSWSDSLQDASFRGAPFDVVRCDDEGEHALAIQSVPYTDGGVVHDTGMEPMRYRLEAMLWGPDYLSRLVALVKALRQSGSGELVHPIYGVLTVNVERFNVRHEAEDPDQARIDLAFVEPTPSLPVFVAAGPREQLASVIAIAQQAVQEDMAKVLRAQVPGSASLPVQPGVQTAARRLLSAVGKLRAKVAMTVATLDPFSQADQFLAELAGGLSGLVDLRDFSPIGLLASWQALRDALRDIVRLPPDDTDGPEPVSQVALLTSVALTQSEGLARVVEADEATPVLTPAELESILAEARETMVAAIAAARVAGLSFETIDALKTVAGVQLEAVSVVLAVKPPLVRRAVEEATTLRLIAHRWYGDHSRAEELRRLNPQLRAPNFIQRGEVLNAFAS